LNRSVIPSDCSILFRLGDEDNLNFGMVTSTPPLLACPRSSRIFSPVIDSRNWANGTSWEGRKMTNS
uniref:Ovule protein n=1 Tax=Haemonchus placei TaxID=6290 RepID=A0A158QNK7_HAEPC